MPRRKIVKANMPICCLEKIGYQYIRFKVLSVLEDLNASGREDIVNSVMAEIREKTQLQVNSNSITNVDDNKFMESELFQMQAPHNINMFSLGIEQKRPQDKFVWKKNGKFVLEIKKIEGDQEIEGDQKIEIDQEIEGDQKIEIDQKIEGDQEIEGDQKIEIDQKIEGDHEIEGDQKIEIDQKIEGDQKNEGDQKIEVDQKRLGNAAKQYLNEGTNSDNKPETKDRRVKQITDIIDICYQITISKIVVTALKDHQGSLSVWEEDISITSLVSLLVILLDLLTQKYDSTYTFMYKPYLPGEKKAKKKPEQLEYPFSIHRVYPLSREDMKQALESKLKNCGREYNYEPSKSLVVGEVLKSINMRITKKGKMDQRYKSTQSAKCTGFSSDGRITPYTSNMVGPPLAAKIENISKEAQDTVFRILQRLNKLPRDYNIERGYLYFNRGRRFTSLDFCNALDAVTIQFLPDRPATLGRPRNDDQKKVDDKLKDIYPLVTELLKTIFSRLMSSAIYEDDIMSQEGYDIWRVHVKMIISCVALLVGVLEYTRCTKEKLKKHLRKSIKEVNLLKYSGRRRSFPCTNREYNTGANGNEASVYNEAKVDYQNMADLEVKLESEGFQMTMSPTPCNDNCQFHALAEQLKLLERNIEHLEIRKQVVDRLTTWKGSDSRDLVGVNKILEVMDKTLKGYIDEMGKPGTYGDQISLIAATSVLKCNIKLISTDQVRPLTIKCTTTPSGNETPPTINLGHINKRHYYSLKPKVYRYSGRRHSCPSALREYNAGGNETAGDEESIYSKHMRYLKEILVIKGFQLSTPPTNGDCQFDALAEQAKKFLKQNITQAEVRENIVKCLQNNENECQEKVKADLEVMNKTLKEYIEEMKEPGTWGDQISLKAAAFALKCNIRLISADREQLFPGPPNINNLPTIYLGYIQWIHYASVEPTEDELVPRRLDMDE